MINNGLRYINNKIKNASNNIPQPLGILMCPDDMSISSELSKESSNELPPPMNPTPSKAWGRPSGTSNNDRCESNETICLANEKVAQL